MMESLEFESLSTESHMLEHDLPRAVMDHQMKDARSAQRRLTDFMYTVQSLIMNKKIIFQDFCR